MISDINISIKSCRKKHKGGLYYSPASFNAISSSSADNLKSVCLIFSRRGFIDVIIPFSFALIITPSVPVIRIPSFSAIFRALLSSNMIRQSGVSNARVIALDSPLSICISNICCLYLSVTFLISTHSGKVSPYSMAISVVVLFSRKLYEGDPARESLLR